MTCIEPYASTRPIHYDPYLPIDPPSEKIRRIPLEYSRDTLAKAQSPESPYALQIAVSLNSQETSAPKLPPPNKDINLAWTAGKEELEQLITKVSETEDSENGKQEKPSDKSFSESEILLMKVFIELMKSQNLQMEEGIKISFDATQKHQTAYDTIKKEMFAHFDEYIAQKKKSQILNWINGISCGALMTVGIASFALSFFSAGTSLPLSISVTVAGAQGVLGVVSAGGQAFKGYIDYSLNLTRGDMEELKWALKQITSKKQRSAEEMHESFEVFSRNWKECVKVFENLVLTATSMIR